MLQGKVFFVARRPFSLLTIAALVASLVIALVPSNVALAQEGDGAKSEVYIVRMVDNPAVAYDGGIPGLKATRPAKGTKIDPADTDVASYVSHLTQSTTEVARQAQRRSPTTAILHGLPPGYGGGCGAPRACQTPTVKDGEVTMGTRNHAGLLA